MSEQARNDNQSPSELVSTAPLDFQEVLKNPAAWFAAPHEIVEYGEFDYDQKHQLLESWQTDVKSRTDAAGDDASGSADRTLLDEIVDAIKDLGNSPPR